LVSGIGFWWDVGGGDPNRCAALTDCLGGQWGGDIIGFVVRYFGGLLASHEGCWLVSGTHEPAIENEWQAM
jgi:hypothetical protein